MDSNIDAKFLVEHFIPVVYPFSTNSYLTGTEYKDVKFNSALCYLFRFNYFNFFLSNYS